MKKKLVQKANEPIRDFYNRCVSCQYLLCDDYSETVLDSEIMMNLLVGMHKKTSDKLYEKLNHTELDLNLCLSEAEVIESEVQPEIPEIINMDEDSDEIECLGSVVGPGIPAQGSQGIPSQGSQGIPSQGSQGIPNQGGLAKSTNYQGNLQYNHTAGTFKMEPLDPTMPMNSNNLVGASKTGLLAPAFRPVQKVKAELPGTPPKKMNPAGFGTQPNKIKSEFGTPPKKMNPGFGTPQNKIKSEFGTPPKKIKSEFSPKPNANFGGTPSPNKFGTAKTKANFGTPRNITPAANLFQKLPDGKATCLTCNKTFSRIDVAKMHYIKNHQEDQAIECPLCKNYHAKNTYDWNDHAKAVHQMTANDMKSLEIVYSPTDPADAILAKRPDGRVACLKCVDEAGCHKTFSRIDVAKLHFKKVHGAGNMGLKFVSSTPAKKANFAGASPKQPKANFGASPKQPKTNFGASPKQPPMGGPKKMWENQPTQPKANFGAMANKPQSTDPLSLNSGITITNSNGTVPNQKFGYSSMGPQSSPYQAGNYGSQGSSTGYGTPVSSTPSSYASPTSTPVTYASPIPAKGLTRDLSAYTPGAVSSGFGQPIPAKPKMRDLSAYTPATASSTPSGYGTIPSEFGTPTSTPSGYGQSSADILSGISIAGPSAPASTSASGYGTTPSGYGTPAVAPSGYGTTPSAITSGYGTTGYGTPTSTPAGYGAAPASAPTESGIMIANVASVQIDSSTDQNFGYAQTSSQGYQSGNYGGFSIRNDSHNEVYNTSGGTFKREPSDLENQTNFGTPPKQAKTEFGTPSKNMSSLAIGTPPKMNQNKVVPEGFSKTDDGKIICLAEGCGKTFTRLDNAKVHAIKSHSPDQLIPCPLCKNYLAKNPYDYNEHAKKVHQLSAHDMKNLVIVYSMFDPTDPCMAKRPDGKVVCFKCLDDKGAHKTFTRADNAKVHFKKLHGQELGNF